MPRVLHKYYDADKIVYGRDIYIGRPSKEDAHE